MNDLLTSPEKLIPYSLVALTFTVMLVELALTMGKTFGTKDTFVNLTMYLGYILIGALWIPVVYQIFVLVHDHALFALPTFMEAGPLTWLAMFIADDFCYYWFHRASHGPFWFSHVTHHSSSYFNLSVGFRQTWLPFYAFLFWLPLAFIGFDPMMILTMQMISLAIQGFLHTELIRNYGVLDLVLNSPSHHRVHHGSQEKYVNKNFGGVLIFWDRIFGTFQKEEEQAVYGIGEPPSYNPLKIAFGELAVKFRRPSRRSRV